LSKSFIIFEVIFAYFRPLESLVANSTLSMGLKSRFFVVLKQKSGIFYVFLLENRVEDLFSGKGKSPKRLDLVKI
jgi:hypothetical protein